MHTHNDHWLASVVLGVVGIYVLLAALALGELASARWGLWLVLVAVACFAAALRLGAAGLKRLLRD